MLDRLPHFRDALATGAIGAEHVDAVCTVTWRLPGDVEQRFLEQADALLVDATRLAPDRLERACRDVILHLEHDQGVERNERQRRETRLTTRIDRHGMYVRDARMHPELGSAVFRAVDAEAGVSTDRAQLAAEALGNLVTGGHQAARARDAEIVVIVDAQTAADAELHDHSVCELADGSPLPPPAVRRLLCNGVVRPVILGTDGVPISVGRGRRIANRAQRRALRAVYRTCAFGDRDVEFDRCEIHHIVPWELGGPTDLSNLLPLCSRHHHVVHEGGWSIGLAPDRALTIRRRSGAVYWRGSPPTLRPGRGRHRRRRSDAPAPRREPTAA